MGRKHKKGKRRGVPGLKPICVRSVEQLEALRDLARDHDLTVRFTQISKTALHFMFDGARGRVLNWWPSTGTWYSPVTYQRGRAGDCWAALDEAARIAAMDPAPTPEEEHLSAIARRH